MNNDEKPLNEILIEDDMLSQEDELLIKVIVALLYSAKIILPFNIILTCASLFLSHESYIAMIITVVMTLWIAFLHVRIAFDIPIFVQFREGLSEKKFDEILVETGLKKVPLNLTINERCAGAVLLWKKLLLSTVIQGVCLLLIQILSL